MKQSTSQNAGNNNLCKETPMKLWGSVTVGPKGQVVIPKEVRELLAIKPGDTLLAISKGDVAVCFIKNEDMNHIMEYIQNEMNNTNTL